MKEQWKKVKKWLWISLVLLCLSPVPMVFFPAIYSCIIFICQLSAAMIVTFKRNIKPYAAYSVTAVVMAGLTAWLAVDTFMSTESRFMIMAGYCLLLFIVTFELIMAAVVYVRGRKKYAISIETSEIKEEIIMDSNMYGELQEERVTAEPIEKEIPEYTKAEKLLSVFSMIAAFCFVRYVLFHAMGFITTGIFTAIISVAIIYMRKKGCELSAFNKLLAAVLYVFSLVFSLTANTFIKNLDAVFLIGALTYFVYSVGSSNKDLERFFPFAMLKAVFTFPFSRFGTQASITSDSLSNSRTGSNAKHILIGLIITVPLTLVVAALLMSADDGLERMLTGFADKVFREELGDIMIQLLIAIPCSLYLFGMFYSNSHRNELLALNEQECTQKLYNMRFISNLIVYTAVTPICILYALFFISQAGYYLSAFTNSLPEGFTYADYARRGFFELFAVALINLGVICFMSLCSKKAGREKPFALKLYNVLISVFTLILIATAMSKMIMYINRYGLTALRLYTSWFMLLIGIIFVLVIMKQFRFDMKLSKHIAVAFTLMFAILCFSRPDAVIARYNIEMYSSGALEELDTDAILDLSDDALLTAYNANVITAEDIAEHRRYTSDSLSGYNITSVILNSKMQ